MFCLSEYLFFTMKSLNVIGTILGVEALFRQYYGYLYFLTLLNGFGLCRCTPAWQKMRQVGRPESLSTTFKSMDTLKILYNECTAYTAWIYFTIKKVRGSDLKINPNPPITEKYSEKTRQRRDLTLIHLQFVLNFI